MATTVEAIYDGEVLRPTGPLPFAPNTRVRITVESAEVEKVEKSEPRSFFAAAREMRLDGPPDWSANFDKYLEELRRSHEQ